MDACSSFVTLGSSNQVPLNLDENQKSTYIIK